MYIIRYYRGDTILKINELIKTCHNQAVEKGFYDCPECEGFTGCNYCDGTGINPDCNIAEKLMLIVSELSGALEAHRNNKFCDINICEVIKNGFNYYGKVPVHIDICCIRPGCFFTERSGG